MLSTNNVSYIELAITCYTLTGTQKDPLVEKLLIRSPAISDDHKIYTNDSEKSMLQKFHTRKTEVNMIFKMRKISHKL